MQLELVSREEALSGGLSKFALHRRVKTGKWQEIFPAIYLPSPQTPSHDQRLLAACEWSGGVISHRAAAARYGLMSTSVVELTTTRYVRSQCDVVVHRVNSLDERELTKIGVIPITTPTCTLIDLGAVENRTALRGAVYEALKDPARGRRGMAELRAVLKEGTDSYLERLLKPILKRSTLPPAAVQYRVDLPDHRYYLIDFAYPKERIAVEADGWAFHSDPRAFENDRRKWRELAALGWTVLCFTYDDIKSRPVEILATIAAAINNRVTRGA